MNVQGKKASTLLGGLMALMLIAGVSATSWAGGIEGAEVITMGPTVTGTVVNTGSALYFSGSCSLAPVQFVVPGATPTNITENQLEGLYLKFAANALPAVCYGPTGEAPSDSLVIVSVNHFIGWGDLYIADVVLLYGVESPSQAP